MAKHDWIAIRQEYVEGYDEGGHLHYPTMDELAARHRCSPPLLRERGSNEDWVGDRDKFRTRVVREREAKRSTLLANEGAAFDAACMRFAADSLAIIEKARTQHITRKVRGRVAKYDPLELQRLMTAARQAQTIGRVALGEIDVDVLLPPPPAGSAQLTTTIRVAYEKVPVPEASGG